MLADFQQALADLTASPEFCIRARKEPSLLHERYRLTEPEWRRLVAVVRHPGMECVCMLYRANRLAPLALHVPEICATLGTELRAVVSEYWKAFPDTTAHVYMEADRFCRYLTRQLADGRTFACDLAPVLGREAASVAAALEASYTEGR
jgi:hypothetical protein